MTEKQMQDAIVAAATTLGWRTYHPYDSRRSAPGFPDLCMVREQRLVFAELKSTRGKITMPQALWLDALKEAGVECYVWRPAEWESGEIVDLLAARKRDSQ